MATNKLKHLVEKIQMYLFFILPIGFLIFITIIGIIKKNIFSYLLALILIFFIILLSYYEIYKKLFTIKKKIKRKNYSIAYSYDKRKNKIYDQEGININIKKEYYEKFAKKIINILRKYTKKDECGIEYIEYLNKKGKHIHKYKSCSFKEAFKIAKKYWNEDAPEIVIGDYRQVLFLYGPIGIKFYKYSNSVLVAGNNKFINYVLNKL